MQESYNGISVPGDGQGIGYSNGKYEVPDHPVIPFIEGDGDGAGYLEGVAEGVRCGG